jgi:hypothetical protein
VCAASEVVIAFTAKYRVVTFAADEEIIPCSRSDCVVASTTIESVVVFAENDELGIVIGVHDVAAFATGDDS